MKQLVLGGARSGKSRYGEQWVLAQAASTQAVPTYVATADWEGSDAEMRARIQRHRQDRANEWQCREEPLFLSQLLCDLHTKDGPILIDCLTLWLSNCLMADCWSSERDAFVNAFTDTDADVTLVSNEVGLGVVPMGKLSRRFVDESGFLHQVLAAQCDRVVFCAAGLPLVMKGE